MEEQHKCNWCLGDALYEAYHDQEWGVPVYDDATLFEFLLLETFQAGLSWITILRKREHFRKVFDNFDYQKIALYNEEKVQELLQDPGIIRNQLKVRGSIKNAVAFMKVQQEFGSFSTYIWGFVNHQPIVNLPKSMQDLVPKNEISDALSKDMKKRGFTFVGSTVMYAHLQATGLINDHLESCFRRNEILNQYPK